MSELHKQVNVRGNIVEVAPEGCGTVTVAHESDPHTARDTAVMLSRALRHAEREAVAERDAARAEVAALTKQRDELSRVCAGTTAQTIDMLIADRDELVAVLDALLGTEDDVESRDEVRDRAEALVAKHRGVTEVKA